MPGMSSPLTARRSSRSAEHVLTAGQARRIAIAAQRFGTRLPPVGLPGEGISDHSAPAGRPVNRGHLSRLVRAIGLLQIDSVNVLARAHLLPVFSRLGPYPYSLLEGAAWPTRSSERLLVEAWAHVASLIPVQVHPLLRWRQQEWARRPAPRVDAIHRSHPGFLDTVLGVIDERGPSSAGDIEAALEAPGRGTSGWWEWSITKTACEYLFLTGAIGVSYRRGFERCYDLIERVLPRAVSAAATPSIEDAQRELTALAVRSHGVGTAGDIADYYRLSVAATRRGLQELVEDGRVRPVRVDGWKEQAYLHTEARIPRKVAGAALLCPFDPLVWERARTQRLFGFHYRIEIYTPEPQRRFGYYVFPLLVGEQLVGRVDLKADRATSRLLVQASWIEEGADPVDAADAAAVELARMAQWLALDEIVVMPRGDLWQTLAARPGMTVGSLPG